MKETNQKGGWAIRQILVGLLILAVVVCFALSNVGFGQGQMKRVGQAGVRVLTTTPAQNLAER